MCSHYLHSELRGAYNGRPNTGTGVIDFLCNPFVRARGGSHGLEIFQITSVLFLSSVNESETPPEKVLASIKGFLADDLCRRASAADRCLYPDCVGHENSTMRLIIFYGLLLKVLFLVLARCRHHWPLALRALDPYHFPGFIECNQTTSNSKGWWL